MQIRIAELADVRSLVDLHGQSFEAGWPDSDFVTHIQNAADDVLVADEANGKNADCLGFSILRTIGTDSEILTIVVQEQARGQGVGGALLAFAMNCVRRREANTVFLEVAADNQKAMNLYGAAGFYRYGTCPGYYRRSGGRVDAILFQKQIEVDISE